ncbi:OmpP1/FadL family transporter [Salinisphaera orenii]|uniref:OmpP1/FadL family transporter n=1 Tax=Salinisphaera orenii TaxID=856731 RepID=UPI000F4C2F07|nr:porin [Salinisphaera orenii]
MIANRKTIKKTTKNTCICSLTWLYALSASAGNGVELPGYGAKSQGMGGVSIALPQDSTASANNPAGMALVGDRMDVDVTVLYAPVDADVGSDSYSTTAFVPVPTAGFNKVLNEKITVGLTIFGHGLGIDYEEPLLGTTDLKADLKQVVAAPTVTYQLSPNQYIGFSPRLAYQRLDIGGLEGVGFSNPGSETSYGYGFAVGYQGKLFEDLSLGVTYFSRIKYGELDRYDTLLPNGRLNMPRRAGVGLSYQYSPKFTLAADFLWINWAGEEGYGNKLSEGGPMGANDGPGFGWKDQNIFRFGASYVVNRRWTVRAGASFASELIPKSETTLSTLAPLNQYDHYSLGVTYKASPRWEITGSYTYADYGSIRGTEESQGINFDAHIDYINVGLGYNF